MQVGRTSKWVGCATLFVAFGFLLVVQASAALTAQQLDKIRSAARAVTKAESLYKSGKMTEAKMTLAVAAYEAAQKAVDELADDSDLTKQHDTLAKRLGKLHDSMALDGAKLPAADAEPAASSGSSAADPATTTWLDVTNNVGGDRWGAYGVTYMSAVPHSNAVIAGVSEVGLWKSTDAGKSWTKLGGNEIKNRPGRIVYDPKNPATFWVSGCYGDSPFRTDDDGKSFLRLGNLSHSDGVAVDFTDPQRRTLLLGLHEQSQSTELSTDKGMSWTKIGANLPPNSNHSSDPVVIDAKTFLTNTAGWKQGASMGIYRTEDGGQTWTQVSDSGPAGQALVASDGSIYWQRIWGGGLLKSTDKGKTWKQISNAVKSNPIELSGKRLAATNGDQVLVSSDGGETWTAFGPKIPFNPNGIIYSDKGQSFYAWVLADNMKKPAASIVRLSMK